VSVSVFMQGCVLRIAATLALPLLACGASSVPPAPSPGPAHVPAPTSMGGNSSVCFDPSFHSTGTRWVERRTVTQNGTFYQSLELDHEVLGPAVFNGNEAVAVRQVLRFTAGAGAGVWSDHRFYARYDGVAYRTFGNEGSSRTTAGRIISSRTTYVPSTLLMVAVSPGRSFSHTYTNTYTQTAPLPAPAARVVSVTVTQTFLGFETVRVPAGTFVDACKFLASTSFDGGPTTEANIWRARGSEVQLRRVAKQTVTVMDSATRNGTPITP
jgi:hypothetical protein